MRLYLATIEKTFEVEVYVMAESKDQAKSIAEEAGESFIDDSYAFPELEIYVNPKSFSYKEAWEKSIDKDHEPVLIDGNVTSLKEIRDTKFDILPPEIAGQEKLKFKDKK